MIVVTQGDTRSLDYSSCGVFLWPPKLGAQDLQCELLW